MKFCKDCRWYIGGKHSHCISPQGGSAVDPITGSVNAVLAIYARKSLLTISCGPDAKYFEPKQSIWTKIKEYFK